MSSVENRRIESENMHARPPRLAGLYAMLGLEALRKFYMDSFLIILSKFNFFNNYKIYFIL
jgi:hypothetical protein